MIKKKMKRYDIIENNKVLIPNISKGLAEHLLKKDGFYKGGEIIPTKSKETNQGMNMIYGAGINRKK
jgi:hypothetical protein